MSGSSIVQGGVEPPTLPVRTRRGNRAQGFTIPHPPDPNPYFWDKPPDMGGGARGMGVGGAQSLPLGPFGRGASGGRARTAYQGVRSARGGDPLAPPPP